MLSSSSSRGASSEYGVISITANEGFSPNHPLSGSTSTYGVFKKETKPNGYGTIFRPLAVNGVDLMSVEKSECKMDSEGDLEAILNTNHSIDLFESDFKDSNLEIEAMEKIRQDLRVHERALLRDALLIAKVFHQRVHSLTKDYHLLEEMFIQIDSIATSISKFIQEIDSLQLLNSQSQTGNLMNMMIESIGTAVTKQDALLRNMTTYISALYQLKHSNAAFRMMLNDFEASSECYLPVIWLLIRVLNRLLHWQEACARVVEILLANGHVNGALGTARMAVDHLAHHSASTAPTRKLLYDFAVLLEIESQLCGITPIMHPDRHLLMLGRVSEVLNDGFAPRLLLLFNDVLMVTTENRDAFSILRLIHLSNLKEGSASLITQNSRTCILVDSEEGRFIFTAKVTSLWLETVSEGIRMYHRNPPALLKLQLVLERKGNSEGEINKLSYGRLTLMSACWLRGGTIGREEIHQMAEKWRVGVLLRRLRSSSGWQRLFVLHSHGHLFFFNSHKDSHPLAALCLLEYGVSVPTLHDQIPQRNVFKISHQQLSYFFRTDSHYSFLRWVESVRASCLSRRPLDALTALSVHL
ncbi:unnamed protein product, partial [Mesorhabditis belari]|uniref:PH domain-containing protein n=1 Tax=Mesorhabditis belari TaxID=2138241 RepID=A0AAF3EAB7_9BILA